MSLRALNDFISPTGFPLPWNPVTMSGLHDYAPATDPWLFPRNPVAGFVQAGNGSLPKAPSLPRALIGAKNMKAAAGIGCGPGCAGCGGGMGALTGDTVIPQAMLPAFLQGDAYITGFPTVYLAAGVLVAAFMFMGGGAGGRRRR